MFSSLFLPVLLSLWMDIDGLELISKLNFLDQEDQEQSNMSSNPFDEPNDPADLNPFSDPDEDGKE